jgi:hypothetical protein
MWVISFLEFLMNSVMWTRKGRAVRFVPWPKNAVSTFMNYNLCEIWTENFLTQLKSSGGRFAEDAWVHEIVRECVHEIIRECVRNFRRMKTSGNLAARETWPWCRVRTSEVGIYTLSDLHEWRQESRMDRVKGASS